MDFRSSIFDFEQEQKKVKREEKSHKTPFDGG